MPTAEAPVDYAAYAPTAPDKPYRETLDPLVRQEYESQRTRWRKARINYQKEPATASAICVQCMRRLDPTVGYGVHQNVIALQATLLCLGCVEKSSKTDWYTIVKEV